MQDDPTKEPQVVPYSALDPQNILITDGVRSRKTDTGFVVEVIQPDGTWIQLHSQQPPGSLILNKSAVSSDFTFGLLDFARYMDCGGGGITANLPPAIGTGQLFLGVKIDDSDNIATILPAGSDLIDGSSSVNLVTQWADCLIQDYALGFWHQIGGNAAGLTPVDPRPATVNQIVTAGVQLGLWV